jgi:hypothetical protein
LQIPVANQSSLAIELSNKKAFHFLEALKLLPKRAFAGEFNITPLSRAHARSIACGVRRGERAARFQLFRTNRRMPLLVGLVLVVGGFLQI